MIIYRIARAIFNDTSGEGAKKYGGRWNLPGYAVLYGSASIAAALLERLTVDPELFSSERYSLYAVMEIECSDHQIFKPSLRELPLHWDKIPFTKVSQEYGTELIKKGLLCFAVPSVVDRTSLNFVLNVDCREFPGLSIRTYPLQLDHRIIRGGGD